MRILEDGCFKDIPPHIRRDQLEQLVEDYRRGDDCVRDQIILGHIRMAIALIKPYIGWGLTYEELTSHAIALLIEAVHDAKDRLHNNDISPYLYVRIQKRLRTLIRKDIKQVVRGDITSHVTSKDEGISEILEIIEKSLVSETQRTIVIGCFQGKTYKELANEVKLGKSQISRLWNSFCDTFTNLWEK